MSMQEMTGRRSVPRPEDGGVFRSLATIAALERLKINSLPTYMCDY